MADVTRFLADLVAFKTISKTNNLSMVEYLEHHHKALGFDCVRVMSPDDPPRANLLCRLGPDREGGLMLSGHMDVVPVSGQQWHSDPFELAHHEHRLIGRGACDMKGFIAAVCHALLGLNPHTLKKPLFLLWTYDEEVGCTGSGIAVEQLHHHVKHLPQAALIGEPTDFSIMRMHAGHVTVKITCTGKGAHSSDPERGISAIKAAHDALRGIFALEQELKREEVLKEYFRLPYATMNVGEIHGGSAVNIVPDQAVITLGFRPLPTMSVDVILERLKDAINKNQHDERAKVVVSTEKNTPSMITKEGSELERILASMAQPGSVSAQFATDGGNLSRVGIPCLIFGPGSIDVAHQANEWIDERDVKRASDYVSSIIERWQAL